MEELLHSFMNFSLALTWFSLRDSFGLVDHISAFGKAEVSQDKVVELRDEQHGRPWQLTLGACKARISLQA